MRLMNMKNKTSILFLLIATFGSSVAQANSTKCVTLENELNKDIYAGLSLINTLPTHKKLVAQNTSKTLCVNNVSDTINGGFLIFGDDEFVIECRVNAESSYRVRHFNDCSGLIEN